MSREIVQTETAPKAIGPYAQAIRANGFIYTAGQIPIDPKTGEFVSGGIAAQTRQHRRGADYRGRARESAAGGAAL